MSKTQKFTKLEAREIFKYLIGDVGAENISAKANEKLYEILLPEMPYGVAKARTSTPDEWYFETYFDGWDTYEIDEWITKHTVENFCEGCADYPCVECDEDTEIFDCDHKVVKVKTPETLEEAVLSLVANNKNQIEKLRKEDLSKYHHTTGMNLRNAWGLWNRNSTLHKHFRTRFGLGHADDMSGLIFHCFKRAITKQPWDIEAEIEKYRKHWAKYGLALDSETKI